jgi:hypothetical protein
MAQIRNRIPESRPKVKARSGQSLNRPAPQSKPKDSGHKGSGGVTSADPYTGGYVGPVPPYVPTEYDRRLNAAYTLLQLGKFDEIIQRTRDAFWFTPDGGYVERDGAGMALAIAYFRKGDPVEALRYTRDYLTPPGGRIFPESPNPMDHVASCIAYYGGFNAPGLKEYLLNSLDSRERIGVFGNTPAERKALAILALANATWFLNQGPPRDSLYEMGALLQPNNPVFGDALANLAMNGDTVESIMADAKRGILRIAAFERAEKFYQRVLPLVGSDTNRRDHFKQRLINLDFYKWTAKKKAIAAGWKP